MMLSAAASFFDTTIIVPVSGGKDSQVVLSLALKAARERVVCVHQNTGYDHPDTYKQIDEMETFYGVKVEHTHNKWGGMFGWLDTAAYFPNSAARGCTQRLKQEPFARWLKEKKYSASNCEIWFGMRSDESAARDAKYGAITPEDEFTLGDIAAFYSTGWRGKAGLGLIPVRLPIVSWNTEQVFAHLREEGSPLNPLYDRGHTRVGCYPCFLGRKAEWKAAGKDPVGKQHIEQLVSLENAWNIKKELGMGSNKFIKVHRRWDVREFIADDALPASDDDNDASGECGYCSI